MSRLRKTSDTFTASPSWSTVLSAVFSYVYSVDSSYFFSSSGYETVFASSPSGSYFGASRSLRSSSSIDLVSSEDLVASDVFSSSIEI